MRRRNGVRVGPDIAAVVRQSRYPNSHPRPTLLIYKVAENLVGAAASDLGLQHLASGKDPDDGSRRVGFGATFEFLGEYDPERARLIRRVGLTNDRSLIRTVLLGSVHRLRAGQADQAQNQNQRPPDENSHG